MACPTGAPRGYRRASCREKRDLAPSASDSSPWPMSAAVPTTSPSSRRVSTAMSCPRPRRTSRATTNSSPPTSGRRCSRRRRFHRRRPVRQRARRAGVAPFAPTGLVLAVPGRRDGDRRRDPGPRTARLRAATPPQLDPAAHAGVTLPSTRGPARAGGRGHVARLAVQREVAEQGERHRLLGVRTERTARRSGAAPPTAPRAVCQHGHQARDVVPPPADDHFRRGRQGSLRATARRCSRR